MKYMLITLPGLFAVGGALIYGLPSGKASELGRLMFACGLLALLIHLR